MANTYTTYKDSGIPWIGEIPSEWNLERLQTMTYEIVEKNNPIQTNNVLSLTIKDGVIPYEEKGDVGNKSKDNYEEYKLAYPETIVLNSMNILIGAVGLCKYFGCVSPVYYVLKNSPNSNLKYLFYILSSQPFQRYLRKFANGILEIRLRISSQDIIKRHIPCPSLYEQDSIANFLDKKCSEIDELISLQEKMIDELKAYKQSVITETVTQGLDRNVKMKDCGVNWIGEIPEHWSTLRIKYLLNERKERSETGLEEPLSMSQKHGLIPTKDMDNVPNMASSFIGAKITYIDDLVFNKLKAHLGVFSVSRHNGLVSPDYAVYFSKGNVNVKYLEYLFKTPIYISEFKKLSSGVGAGLTRLYTNDLYSIHGIYPPISEQEKIVEYINTKCSEIDSLISIKEKKIEELKDYKKSLIYEYVTGKKRV